MTVPMNVALDEIFVDLIHSSLEEDKEPFSFKHTNESDTWLKSIVELYELKHGYKISYKLITKGIKTLVQFTKA